MSDTPETDAAIFPSAAMSASDRWAHLVSTARSLERRLRSAEAALAKEQPEGWVLVHPRTIDLLRALSQMNQIDRMEADGKMREFIEKMVVAAKESMEMLSAAGGKS